MGLLIKKVELFKDSKSNNNDSGYCTLQTDTNLSVKTTTGSYVGGAVDKEVVKIAMVPSDLPEWNIVSPIACPHYTQHYYSTHRAVDLVNINCNNNLVVAVDGGTVTFTGWMGDYGNRIEITHINGMVSTYSHLSKISVKTGDTVISGQTIGIMGSTGRSTGRHLHYEIIYQNVKVDPEIYLK
jgi:murein DD-endopeptidase MepM/ murein hydrolase activator NlpD